MQKLAQSGTVHLILGEDTYLAERALEEVLEAAVGADRADSVTLLYGDEVRWEAVLAAVRTGSLFARRRVVVVRRAELLRFELPGGEEGTGAAKGKGKAMERQDPLASYLDDPAPDVALVLLAARPDRRRNPWKRLSLEGKLHSVEPKKGRALRAYVEQDLRRRGLRVTAEAVSDLIDEVGQDLRRLMGEVDKLEAWSAGATGPLTADAVHAVLGRGLGRPLYLLADALSARDLPASLQRLEELLQGGEEGLRILATLHRSLRQVRAAVAMRGRGLPKAEVGARLLPPHMQFKLDGLMEASRQWSEPDLRTAVAVFAGTDRAIKKGAEPATALITTLVRSCRGSEKATSSRRGR